MADALDAAAAAAKADATTRTGDPLDAAVNDPLGPAIRAMHGPSFSAKFPQAAPSAQAPGELVSKLSYPFTWLMGQLGNRVDALEATAGKTGLSLFKPHANFDPFADAARAVIQGKPPTDLQGGAMLPPGQASYTLARQAGLDKLPAQLAATAGAFAVGGPMNAVGEGIAGAAGQLANAARNSAMGQKIAELPGVRDVGSALSRTFELTPAEKAAEAQGMFEGRGTQRLMSFDYATLGAERANAAKIGAKARGITPEEADSQMRTAVEDLSRFSYGGHALQGLTPQEQDVVLKTSSMLEKNPGQRAALQMRPYGLSNQPTGIGADQPVAYEPRLGTPKGKQMLAAEAGQKPPGTPVQGRPVSDMRTGPTPQRVTAPTLTTAQTEQATQARLGTQEPIVQPSSKALPIYGASQGQKMRNATILDKMVSATAKPASAFTGADKGVEVSNLGLSGGMSDAWKAKYANMRVPARISRYMDNWATATQPGNLGKLQSMQEGLVRAWKPLVTTANPAFVERFAATHAAALVANGEANPRTIGLGALLESGHYDPSAPVGIHFPNAPGVKTLQDAQRLAVKSGWAGSPQQEFRSLLSPVAKANEAVYSATKKAMGFSRLAKGDTPQQAADFVRTRLGDYSPENFTNFVNDMSRKNVPFLRFSYQLVPAVGRLVTQRPGTMGAFQETGMNQAARLGLGQKDLQRLGKAAYDPMAIPIARGQGPDSNQVTILDPAMNAGRHLDALFGGRGMGWRGPLNNAVGMLTPPIGIVEQARTLYSNLQGRAVDPHSFQKLPPSVATLPQSVRDAFHIRSMHGYYIGPPDVASFAYGTPNFLSAFVNAAQAKQNPVAMQGLKRFEGILPVRTVDLGQADRAASAQAYAKRQGQKEERKSLRSLNRRTLADSLAASQGR